MGRYEDAENVRAMLGQLGQDVAKQLGEGWTSEPMHNNGFTLSGPDGVQVWVGRPDGAMVTIHGIYPGRYRPAGAKEINVNALRGPVAVAKEIRRRLLPTYLPLLAEAQSQQRSWEEAEAKRQETMASLVEAWPGARIVGDHVYATIHGHYLKLRVQYGGDIAIDGTLPAHLVFEMLAAATVQVTA